VIPAAVADSWLFWLAIIDGLAAVYILPTVLGIARQVEGLGWVICLNAIPVGWPAALLPRLPDAAQADQQRSSPAAAPRAVADAMRLRRSR